MDMLCIAANHDPIGLVAVNGQGLAVEDIARISGVSASEATALIDELERNDVFTRNRSGIIYNRRMVREAKKSQTAIENGKLGGNPTLRKTRGNSASDNPPLKPPDKSEVKGGDKPHLPLAMSQKPASNSEPGTARESQQQFDELLQKCHDALPEDCAWPVKTRLDLGPVIAAMNEGATVDDVVAAIQVSAKSALAAGRTVGSWKYFEQAIRDRHKSRTAGNGAMSMPKESKPLEPDEKTQHLMAKIWVGSGFDHWNLGSPPPGKSGCKIGWEILREHGIDPETGKRLEPAHAANEGG